MLAEKYTSDFVSSE